jgi:hypothetical protein
MGIAGGRLDYKVDGNRSKAADPMEFAETALEANPAGVLFLAQNRGQGSHA